MSTPVLMSMNMKGGVGKTVIAISIGFGIAWQTCKDVLLIDYDPQANASHALLGPNRYFELLAEGRSLSAALMPNMAPTDPFSIVKAAQGPMPDASSYATKIRRWHNPVDRSRKGGSFSIIPASLDLMRLALNRLPDELEGGLIDRWKALMSTAQKAYECIIIDCHPAGSFFTKSAILASDVVIIPVTTDGYAAVGLGLMRSFMESWAKAGGAAKFAVVFNDPHNAWDDGVESQIRADPRFGPRCLSASLGYSKLFRNIATKHQMVNEQPVAHRWRVSGRVVGVTRELIQMLSSDGVLDKSWTEK